MSDTQYESESDWMGANRDMNFIITHEGGYDPWVLRARI